MKLYRDYIKRAIDFVVAVSLFIALIPVFIIVSLVVRFTMGSPVLFYQQRPGKDEKLFKVVKFRTMTNAKDADGKLLSDELRLNTAGKIMRSLSLDELPQLINVINGDMSLIGPRPLMVKYLPLYNDFEKQRHNLKPGVTGWAQVNGRNAISWKEKFEYDVWYVQNVSFLVDVKIILMTIKKVLRRDDISASGQATVESFKGHS